jgi:hypothetical protein
MKRIAVAVAVVLTTSLSTATAWATAWAADETTTVASSGALIHVTVPSAGISVGFPPTWTVTKDSGLPKAARKKLAKLNPKLATQIESPSNTAFYAIDQTNPGGVTPNINVIVMKSGGFPSSLDDFRQYVTAQYQQVGATVETTGTRNIGGKKAYTATALLDVKVDENTTLHAYVTQLLVPKGDGGAIVSFATADDDAGHALAQQMLASVRAAH